MLFNVGWFLNGLMFQVEGVKIGVDVMVLIGGIIYIKNIMLIVLDILLEQDGVGQVNWDDFIGQFVVDVIVVIDEGIKEGVVFILDQIQIINVCIWYLDFNGINVEILDLIVDFGWGEGVVILVVIVIMGGVLIDVSIEIGDLNDFIVGDVIQVKLVVDVG